MSIIYGSYKYRRISMIANEILLGFIAIIFLLPIFWMFTTAFKTAEQTAMYPPKWIPDPWTIRSFIEGFKSGDFLLYLKNTTVITTLCIIGTLISSSMVAFGFAKMKSRLKNILFAILLSTMMIPTTVTLIPTYVLYSKIGWINTFLPLVIPGFLGGGAFSIFLLRQFFASLPNELGEAAMIDGCSWFRIYWNIYLPNSKPALLVVLINTFVFSWNDYFAPLIYLINPDMFTISIGLNAFKSQYGGAMDVGPLMAMALFSILPVLITFISCQKYFIQGVVTSGIKG